MEPQKINLTQKFEKIEEYWSPGIVGSSNGQLIKIARLKGDFVRHNHDSEDELFFVLEGVLYLEFDSHTVEIKAGEMIVVPKGVYHKPYTKGKEVKVMLIEPESTRHTGDVQAEVTKNDQPWI